MSKIEVLLVDDHELVRAGLKRIIDEQDDMCVVAEASNGSAALDCVRKYNPSVVVMDLAMPLMDGLDATKQIKNLNLDIPILILTVYSEEQYGMRILRAGAKGYLMKQAAPEELVKAIRVLYAGRRYVSNELLQTLAFERIDNRPTDSVLDGLSDRELQVLTMIGQGKTSAAAAKELNLSAKTVETYRRRLQQKLGLTTTAEIVKFAIENQLVKQ